MASFEEMRKIALRNKLLGLWAAEKLKLCAQEADNYSDALAALAFDDVAGDVFGKLRQDFDRAGLSIADNEILVAMEDFLLKAGNQIRTGESPSAGAAAVMLARNLTRK